MKERKKIYKLFKIIYMPLMKLIFRPKVYGKENIPQEGAIILAGNHKHALDPVLVASNCHRFVHFMAKEEVSSGLLKKAFDWVGVIRVYKDRSKNVQSVLEAETLLRAGGTLGIFPEGTRNRTDNVLLKFKTGTVKMAIETNTKIVPFAIKGQYRPFRKGLELEFGKPIDVHELEIKQANELLKSEVYKLLSCQLGRI